MEAAGRWTSLANISTAGTSPTTEQPATHRLHRSLEDVRGHPQYTMGDILDHGSPASGGVPDPTLLDDDSDGQTDAQEIGYIGSSSNITDTIRDNENLTVTQWQWILAPPVTLPTIHCISSAGLPGEPAITTSSSVLLGIALSVHVCHHNPPPLATCPITLD